MRFVVIGNPENRRVQFFEAAARRFALRADVVPWIDVLRDRVDWSRCVDGETVLRIESPGENTEVQRAILFEGADAGETDDTAPRVSRAVLASEPIEHGRIFHPRQWYLGFRRALHALDSRLAAAPPCRRMQTTDGIITMFDKIACQERLAGAGVPVPPSLGVVGSFDELLARMDAAGIHRAFIKLAHGSSASGVVAFERGARAMQAFTSAEIVRRGGETLLFNSLRVRRYRKAAEIAALIDTLARERVQVEAWIPKASLNGKRFDVRQVVIAGRARHAILRLSRGPMTNLHLGNARAGIETLMPMIAPEAWAAAQRTCERALAAFPGSHYAGIDLLIRNDLRRHAVLEVNAFGDLLPNLLNEGLTTYEAQIAALLPEAALPAREAV